MGCAARETGLVSAGWTSEAAAQPCPCRPTVETLAENGAIGRGGRRGLCWALLGSAARPGGVWCVSSGADARRWLHESGRVVSCACGVGQQVRRCGRTKPREPGVGSVGAAARGQTTKHGKTAAALGRRLHCALLSRCCHSPLPRTRQQRQLGAVSEGGDRDSGSRFNTRPLPHDTGPARAADAQLVCRRSRAQRGAGQGRPLLAVPVLHMAPTARGA